MRKAAGVLAIVVGLGLIGFTNASQLFPRASDAQVLADRYRPLMSKAGLADLSHGFDQLLAAGTQLQKEAEPALRARLPTLATFATEWQRSTSAKSHALSDSQVELASTFANADQLPLAPIPWLFIVPGALIALLAGLTLLPARRTAVAPVPVSSTA